MTTNNSSSHIMPTYGRLDVEFTHGEGVFLYDTENTAYIDAISGIGVCALGHAHPRFTQVISEQAQKLIHTSNLYHINNQQALADKLCAISGMENVFFGNSGAEANEAAIKIARLFGHQKGIEEPVIVVFEQSFHGRTLATLTASGNRKIQAGFEPLVQGFIRAPYNDIAALEQLSKNKNIVAVLAEPVQGEGGVNMPDAGFLKALRTLCDEQDWLLMLDEVQTGNGRTGQYFAYQHEGILPDVVTTAKGLGNGLPIGACLAAKKATGLLQPGSHGSTYGGNPLVCSGALATVSELSEHGVIDNANTQGAYLFDALNARLKDCSHVKNIRHKGLMFGIELNHECTDLVGKALAKGLLINVTSGSVVRLLPPLIISRDEIDQLLAILCPLIIEASA